MFLKFRLCAIYLLVTNLLFSLVQFTYAQEQNSLFDKSIEELLGTKISIASPSPESLIETPAVVSKYFRQDLERMGITTLKDMLSFVPGVLVSESSTGVSNSQIRGIDELFNQKILFLLNGVPYHQPSHSFVPFNGVPWLSISHIEVIRGPGAVFHGTQASSGVVNVVTRDSFSPSSVNLIYDSNGKSIGAGHVSFEFGRDSNINLSAEYAEDDGEWVNYEQSFPSVGLVQDEVLKDLDRQSATVRYDKKDLFIQSHLFKSRTIGINDSYTDNNTLQPFIVESEGYLLSTNYGWNTEKTQSLFFADYNYYTFDLTLGNLFGPDIDALATKGEDRSNDYRARAGLSSSYFLNDVFSFVYGLEHEVRSTGQYQLYFKQTPETPLTSLIPRTSIDETSAYGQIEYDFGSVNLLLGTRFTDNELSGSMFTPRAALIYQLDPHQSLKFLYSTGFNSPNPTQTSIYLPGNIIGNKSLNAEVVNSIDFAYSYSSSNLLVVANVYQLEADGFIKRRFSEPLNSVTYYNEENYTRRGAEFDVQWFQTEYKLFTNLSYQHDGNHYVVTDPSLYRVPKLTYSLGASLNLSEQHSLGANFNYISERADLPSVYVLGINYTFSHESYELFFNVKNILDEVILTPTDTGQDFLFTSQDGKGRSMQIGIKLNFE